MIHFSSGVAVWRGSDETRGALFSDVDLEARIPARHPLRKIRQVVNGALVSLDAAFGGVVVEFRDSAIETGAQTADAGLGVSDCSGQWGIA